MKIASIVACLFCSLNTFAADWTPWVTVYSETHNSVPVRVQISFKLGSCKPGQGTSLYRINNEFKRDKAEIRMSFSYYNCQGELEKESFTFSLSRTGRYETKSNWFPGVSIKESYFDVKYTDYNQSSSNKSGSTQNNNTTVSHGPTSELYYPSKKDIVSGKAKPEDAILPNTGTTEINYPGKQELEQRQRLEKIKEESKRIEERYQQTERDLSKAKEVSTRAYEKAVEAGSSESTALAESILAGASEISDPTAALAYTGVGLGLALLKGGAERKAAREAEQEREAERAEAKRQQEQANRLLAATKENFITEAKNINQYSLKELMTQSRSVAVLISPVVSTHEQQGLYFTVPVLVPAYADGSYPSREIVQAKLLQAIPAHIISGKRIAVLYPITDADRFLNDFVKKMGSGSVLHFNANLVEYTRHPFAESVSNTSGTTDYWGNPVKKTTPADAKKKTDKSFWDQ